MNNYWLKRIQNKGPIESIMYDIKGKDSKIIVTFRCGTSIQVTLIPADTSTGYTLCVGFLKALDFEGLPEEKMSMAEKIGYSVFFKYNLLDIQDFESGRSYYDKFDLGWANYFTWPSKIIVHKGEPEHLNICPQSMLVDS